MTTPSPGIARANNNFALDLWARLPPGNLAVSPTSITLAIAMTWGGAKGATADEMRKVMRFEGEPDALLSTWGQLATVLQDPKQLMKLKIANRLYAEKQFEWDTIYFRIINDTFKAGIEVADFTHNAEAERQKINGWVEQVTEQRITNLLPPRSVDAETRIVLVNAIYFLADWETQFNSSVTTPDNFAVSATVKKPVRMMHQRAHFRHAAGNGAALLELPYKGGTTAMYVLLPDDKVGGLAAVEAKLGDTLKELQTKLADENVMVSLPRFTIDPPGSIDLANLLQAMGMNSAFTRGKADFTGIAKPTDPNDQLFISAVLHKAFVKVDEKGTEAAAATAVAMSRGGGPPPKSIEFRADHPFVFLIVDRATGLILFMGRFANPA